MDLIFRDDNLRYTESTSVPANNKGLKLHAYQRKLPKRLFFFLGLYHKPNEGPCDVFLPSDSTNAAYKLFSCIECTATENKTEEFCIQIAEYLSILAQFIDNIYKRRNAYPYSEALMDVLRIYIELEYESLYRDESFMNSQLHATSTPDRKEYGREVTVIRRVMDTLSSILPCCSDYRHDFHHAMRPFNVVLSRDMHLFQVLKSVKLNYQHKNGFIKKTMKEIIDNNAEMSAVIRRRVKSGELNSITKVWTDNAIAFLTERELHSSLTKVIPEDYYKCLLMYGIEISSNIDINLDHDQSGKAIGKSEEMKELVKFLLSDYEDNIHEEFNIDLNSPNTVLDARRFLEPPPSKSSQFMDSPVPVKLETMDGDGDGDGDDEDNDSNTQDKCASSNTNICSITREGIISIGSLSESNRQEVCNFKDLSYQSATQDVSTTNQSRRTSRSTKKERIVGNFIIHDDDNGDDKIIVNDIVCVSDDDDVIVTAPTDKNQECNTSIGESISDDGSQSKEVIADNPLAVLATQAMEKEKVRILSMVTITSPIDETVVISTDGNQHGAINLEKDTNSSTKLNDISNKEEKHSSFVEISDIPKMQSISDFDPTVTDIQNIIDANEPKEAKSIAKINPTTESHSLTDPNDDKTDAQCTIEVTVTLKQMSNAADFVGSSNKSIVSSECVPETIVHVQTPDSDEAATDSTSEKQVSATIKGNYADTQESDATLYSEPHSTSLEDTLSNENCRNTSTAEFKKSSAQNPLQLDKSSTIDEATDKSKSAIITEPKCIISSGITQASQRDMPLLTCELESSITENSLNPIITASQSLIVSSNTISDPKNKLGTNCKKERNLPILPSKGQDEISTPSSKATTIVEPFIANTNDMDNRELNMSINALVTESKHEARISTNTVACITATTTELDINPCEQQSQVSAQIKTNDSLKEPKLKSQSVEKKNNNVLTQDIKLSIINYQNTDSSQETNATRLPSTNSILTVPRIIDESMVAIGQTESSQLPTTNNKTTILMQLVQVGNQLPETIPDVQTGSHLPRLISLKPELGESKNQTITNNNKKLTHQDSATKLSQPKPKQVEESAAITIVINNDELVPLKRRNSLEKTTNPNNDTILPTPKDEVATISAAGPVLIVQADVIAVGGQNVWRAKTDYSNRNILTKAARKQTAELITSSDIGSTGTMTQHLPVTKSTTVLRAIDSAPNEQTSRDPLVCGILPVKLNDEKDPEPETILRNAVEYELNVNASTQHISNDFSCELPEVLLDMEIQTEQVPTAKETHDVNAITDESNKGEDVDQTSECGNPGNQIGNNNKRIDHKIGPNQILSIDATMDKSLLDCLDPQKESFIWHTNDCTAGFCHPALQAHMYKNEQSNNVEGDDEVERLLLSSGSVRSFDVLDDIRYLDTQQLFEVSASEQCDEPAATDSKSVMINNKNIKVRVMDPANLNNMVMHPVNLSAPQQSRTEQHANSRIQSGLDPLIQINENTVEELLQISNNSDNHDVFQEDNQEQEHNMDSNIDIIEAVVTSATVLKNPENRSTVDPVPARSQKYKQFLTDNPTEVEGPITKVVVEHIHTSIYDTVKSKKSANRSYIQFFTPDEPEQSKKKSKKGNKKPASSGATTMPSSSKSPSQSKANVHINSITPHSFAIKTASKCSEDGAAKLAKLHFKGEEKKAHPESVLINRGTTGAPSSTFDRLLTEYRGKQSNTSSSDTSKPASPNSTNSLPNNKNEGKRLTITPKAFNTNTEVTTKQAKRNSTLSGAASIREKDSLTSTPTINSKGDAKKNITLRSTPQGTSNISPHLNTSAAKVQSSILFTDFAQGSPKLHRRGSGSVKVTSSSTNSKSSSQNAANIQKNNTRKGNVNVSEMLQQQQQLHTNRQQQKNAPQSHRSPACDTDYEQQLEERHRRDRNKRLQPVHPANRQNPVLVNSQIRPQHMMYPLMQGSVITQQQSRHNAGVWPQQDDVPRQYYAPPPQVVGHNQEFRPWEASQVQHDQTHGNVAEPMLVYCPVGSAPGMYMEDNTAHQSPPSRPHAPNISGQHVQAPYPHAEANTVEQAPPLPDNPDNSTINNDHVPTQPIPTRKPSKKNRDIYRKLFPNVTSSSLPAQ